MDYSDRIKELRKTKKLSQEKLADMIGVTKQAVSQYERGVRKPDIPTIDALCDVFNVSSDYLLGKDNVTLRFVGRDELRKLDSPQDNCDNICELFSECHGAKAHKMVESFLKLDDLDRSFVLGQMSGLLRADKYIGSSEDGISYADAAHERTDIPYDDELQKQDNAIMDDDNF